MSFAEDDGPGPLSLGRAATSRPPRGVPAAVIRPLLNSLLYFPSRTVLETPDRAGLDYRDRRCHDRATGGRATRLGADPPAVQALSVLGHKVEERCPR